MGSDVVNKNKDCIFYGDYIGRDNITIKIVMFQDSEREFVVTHNANIKPVSYFTGRETELQDLRHRIEEGRKSVLVSGMGGIGKTHICRKLFTEYVNRYAKDKNAPFRHLGYIEYAGDMDSSLQKCLKFKKQDNPEYNEEAAWRELEYLASNGELLLFVDNVNVSMGQDSGLKRLMSIPGAMVLTSRRRAFSKEFEAYRIGFLSTEKCREIYEKIRYEDGKTRVVAKEIPDLEYIIDTLAARHTITIEFLAHLAWTKQWSVQKLRDELDRNNFQLEYIDEEDKLVNIQKSYEKLYDLSELMKAEQNILEAFSIFPYIPLAAETCNEWLLADANVGENNDILMGLYRKGWLQFDENQESYALHPVFAQFIREKCKPSYEEHLGLIKACQDCLEIPDSGLIFECEKFIPFGENILEKMDLKAGIEQADFISVFAHLLQYKAEYKKAILLYEKSISMYKDILGEENASVAINYNDLAGVYVRQGEYDQAEKLYKRGLKIQEKVIGEENFETTCMYNNLAYVYRRKGKYEKAKELNEKSLEIRERMFGINHVETTRCYDALAEVALKLKDYEQAEELFRKCLQIRKKLFPANHLNVGHVYTGLGSVYAGTGRYEDAEKMLNASLEIHKMALGESHPQVAIIDCKLANIFEKRGDSSKALKYNLIGYRILARKVMQIHPDYQKAYKNLQRVFLVCNPNGDFEQWLEEQMKEQ